MPYVTPVTNTTRLGFVKARVLKAARSYLLFDIAQSYIHFNPLFGITGPDALPITAQGYILSCANIFAWLGSAYWTLSMQYSLLAAICVAVRISNPKDWPDVFGAWSDSFTVRRFWG
jgi:hypothetical protein